MGSRSARVEDVFNYLDRILYLSPRLNPSIFGAKKCIGGSGWLKASQQKRRWGRSKCSISPHGSTTLGRIGLTVSLYEVPLSLLAASLFPNRHMYDLNLAKHGIPNIQTGKNEIAVLAKG